MHRQVKDHALGHTKNGVKQSCGKKKIQKKKRQPENGLDEGNCLGGGPRGGMVSLAFFFFSRVLPSSLIAQCINTPTEPPIHL